MSINSEDRLARVAQVIRDEMERIGADQGITLADFDAIAKVVIALPWEAFYDEVVGDQVEVLIICQVPSRYADAARHGGVCNWSVRGSRASVQEELRLHQIAEHTTRGGRP